MLPMTTTPAFEGRPVKTYLGIVGGECLVDVQFLERNAEKNIHDSRAAAMAQLSARATKLGASAVVGMTFDLEQLSPGVRIVIATGTAVVL